MTDLSGIVEQTQPNTKVCWLVWSKGFFGYYQNCVYIYMVPQQLLWKTLALQKVMPLD